MLMETDPTRSLRGDANLVGDPGTSADGWAAVGNRTGEVPAFHGLHVNIFSSLTRPYRNVHCNRAAGPGIRRVGEAAEANGCIRKDSRSAAVVDGRTGLDSRRKGVGGDALDCDNRVSQIPLEREVRTAWGKETKQAYGYCCGG